MDIGKRVLLLVVSKRFEVESTCVPGTCHSQVISHKRDAVRYIVLFYCLSKMSYSTMAVASVLRM